MLSTTYSDQDGLVSPLGTQEEEEEKLETKQILRGFLMMGLEGCKTYGVTIS